MHSLLGAALVLSIGCFYAADRPTVETDETAQSARIDAGPPKVSTMDTGPGAGRENSTDDAYDNVNLGAWDSDDKIKRLISLDELTFQPQWPMPDRGYVPPEAMGHTVSARLHNGTEHSLKGLELKVTVTNLKSGEVLGELETDSVIPYFAVPAKTTAKRTIELTFGDNGEEQSPFADADSWPAFNLSAEILRYRLVDSSEG